MTPREGTLFADRYRLVRKVGGGLVASVWKVLDEETKSFAALKVLSGSMHSHAEALTRFSLEERISSELTGEYFATRIDSGSWQGQRYIAWCWHEGESLRTLFERTQRLDAPTVQSVMEEVASAVSLAHKAGVLHGDIKPENIHFANARPGEARQLKLIGFGIASRAPCGEKFVRGRRRPGVCVGTPLYMSPDCIMGYLPQDARADLWALGVVAYEALVGRPPFVGPEEATVFRAILRRNAPLPSSLVNLPSSVDQWWKRVLAEEFLTAASFCASLNEALRPAIRSSHTQRSARGFAVPAPPAVANSVRPAQAFTEFDSPRADPSGQIIPTGSQSVDKPLASSRGGSRKTSSGLPKAEVPPPPFVPVPAEPSGFPMDARKTLVGLTPFLLTPNAATGARETGSATPERTPPSHDTVPSAGLEQHSAAPGAASPSSLRPIAPISVNSSATMPFPRPELVQPAETVPVGEAPEVTAPPPTPANCWHDELASPQGARRGDTATVAPRIDLNPAAHGPASESEVPGTPTVVLARPAWLESTGLGRITHSETVQRLLGSKERRAQLVAAGIICGSAALVMAVLSLSAESSRQDLEHTSLAVQASPRGSALELESNDPAEPADDTSRVPEPSVTIPPAVKPPAVHFEQAASPTSEPPSAVASAETSAPQDTVAAPTERSAPTAPAERPSAAPEVNLAVSPDVPRAAAVTPKAVRLQIPRSPEAQTTSSQATGLPNTAAGAKTQRPSPSAPPLTAPPPQNNPTPPQRVDPGEFDFGI